VDNKRKTTKIGGDILTNRYLIIMVSGKLYVERRHIGKLP
jgi:hypothetical protein